MISVGIDISKRKSTAAILNVQGEVICNPFEFRHTKSGFEELLMYVKDYPQDEVKFIMEATGIYHLALLEFLKSKGYFVHVANPLLIKKFFDAEIRKGKIDRKDALKLSLYGTEKWFKLDDHLISEKIYSELMMLSREYNQLIAIRTKSKIQLNHLIERIFPGIEKILTDYYTELLLDFLLKYPHVSCVVKQSEKVFTKQFVKMAEKKEHTKGPQLAKKVYDLALECVPAISSSRSLEIAVESCINVLRSTQTSTEAIITQMRLLAKELPEYDMVRSMPGIGDTLAPRLIAEIGDIRRFKNAKSLIAYAGIDAPPYQSGQFEGTRRHISKRGSASLRKCGFEIMFILMRREPSEDKDIYEYIQKKRAEGKAFKVALFAGFNKMLRIYYARTMEIYSKLI